MKRECRAASHPPRRLESVDSTERGYLLLLHVIGTCNIGISCTAQEMRFQDNLIDGPVITVFANFATRLL
jgi:hypothetical protein